MSQLRHLIQSRKLKCTIHFKTISRLKATIIISHRMYITKLADKIILLDKGQLIEEGSFEELIKLKNGVL